MDGYNIVMFRKSLVLLCLSLILLVAAVISRNLILGSQYVTLAPAPVLAGVVSQSLGEGSAQVLPVNGQDYTFTSHYLDKGAWVVVQVKPINSNLNASTMVLQKKDGAYQLYMGPGSAFSTTQLTALPDDVAVYLAQVSGTYTPGSE